MHPINYLWSVWRLLQTKEATLAKWKWPMRAPLFECNPSGSADPGHPCSAQLLSLQTFPKHPVPKREEKADWIHRITALISTFCMFYNKLSTDIFVTCLLRCSLTQLISQLITRVAFWRIVKYLFVNPLLNRCSEKSPQSLKWWCLGWFQIQAKTVSGELSDTYS